MELCGIDEAGRGPLAGPVTAAAVILGPRFETARLADSKALSASQRETIANSIVTGDAQWAVGWVWPAEIDAMNIHHAALAAMSRAFAALSEKTSLAHRLEVVVDGRFCPELGRSAVEPGPPTASSEHSDRWSERTRRRCGITVRAHVGGDREIPEVMAASIVAKVWRDRWMRRYSEWDGRYGFASHKGYPTAEHRRALSDHGACPIHRRTFRAVSPADSVPCA